MKLSAIVVCILAWAGCTDAGLYSSARGEGQADRVTLTGRVCTEDPLRAELPVKIVIVGDHATGDLFAGYDPAGQRIGILSSFVQSTLTDAHAELAVIGFAGRARQLAPIEGEFTRNPGELLNAIQQLGLPQPCAAADLCRDPVEALRATRALIEADLIATTAGERAATQYIVLFVPAGGANPLSPSTACCAPDDAECLDREPAPSESCERTRELQQLQAIADVVSASGAIGLRFHVLHLAAEDPTLDARAQASYEPLAFAGRGVYQRFDAVAGLSAQAFDLIADRQSLRIKTLYVDNPHAHPTPDGPVVDSDVDGMPDAEELRAGTSPTNRDSDEDGIGDLLEVLVGLDPLQAEQPIACAQVDPFEDADLDGLSDCDEALLGTEATLVDSDGDGMPDPLEVIGRTDYLNRDAEADSDGDGVSNGEEIRMRTEPRSTDTRSHLAHGVRAELVDEGIVRELAALRLTELPGIALAPSSATTPGIGVLRWSAADRTLSWQDGGDGTPGAAMPIAAAPGAAAFEVELPSSTAGRSLTARIAELAALPDHDVAERVRIIYRDRQCLSFTVRNVRLMDTLPLDDGSEAGLNRVLLYFAEAAPGRQDLPGPFRIAEVPIVFRPPTERTPSGAVLTVREEEFVRAR